MNNLNHMNTNKTNIMKKNVYYVCNFNFELSWIILKKTLRF